MHYALYWAALGPAMRDTPASILIVDDIAENLHVLSTVLGRAGYVCRPVTSGEMALRTMESALPDLLLIDVRMPEMDGFTLCQRIKAGEHTRDVPVVFISAVADASEKVKAFEAGGVDYITKPFHAAEVLARVRTHLALREARARLQQLNSELEERVSARTEELQQANRLLLAEIRERQQTEEALRQSEERYRLLIETAQEGVWQIDAGGHTVFVNARLAEMFGYAPDDMLGRVAWSFAPDGEQAANRRCLLTGAGCDGEYRYQRRDGSLFWARVQTHRLLGEHAESRGVLAMVVDITARKQEEDLRARLAAIVDGSEDAIASLALDGTVTSWNAGAARLYGYEAVEAVGAPIAALVSPSERMDELLQRMQQPRKQVRVSPFETLHRRKNGTMVDVAVSVSPISDSAGRVVGVSAIARDISERRRAEEMQRRSAVLEDENRRVLEESRLKSGFLANMSHEFRTPLTAIAGFAEFLYDGRSGELLDDHRQLVGNILLSARHLMRIVNDVLDLAKIEAGKTNFRPELVSVAQTVAEVRDVLKSLTLEKQLSIHARVASTLGLVEIDPGRLKQVLYNYLSNAIKASPAGGRITVSVTPDGEDMFRVSVHDCGRGIAPEAQRRLFAEFVQLETPQPVGVQGSGLGLALTKRIVEAQGGTVGMRSTLGKGSTFYAVLPQRPLLLSKRGAEHGTGS